MDYVGMVVGSVVFLYGINITIVSALRKRWIGENALIFDGLLLFFIGVILFIVREDIVKVCLVWAVWSIMREGKELTSAIVGIKNKEGVEVLNLIESIVIIVFSFTMIMNPNEEHVHFHVYLLGAELLLEVIFPVIKLLIARRNRKKKEKQNILVQTFSAINDAIVQNVDEPEEEEKEKPKKKTKKAKTKTKTKEKKKELR